MSNIVLPFAMALSCLWLWYEIDRSTPRVNCNPSFRLASMATNAIVPAFLGGAMSSMGYLSTPTGSFPCIILVCLALSIASSYDAIDGWVPESVWLALCLGQICLVALGVAGPPHLATLWYAALMSALLKWGPFSLGEPIGDADIQAWLALSASLSPHQLMVLLSCSSLLLGTGCFWKARRLPYLPFCFSSLIPMTCILS